MRRIVFPSFMALAALFLTTPSFAGWFDPFVHPYPPYGTDKICDERSGLCRNSMVYDQGAKPNEDARDNYFYGNPNKDKTLPQRKSRTSKKSSKRR